MVKRAFIILAVLISIITFAFTSCSNDVAPVGDGILVINIAGGQSRGVLPAISMNTASFALTVTDSLDNVVISNTLSPDTGSVDYKLPAGTYTIKLDAKNSSGNVIGSGSERVTLVPGERKTTTVTIMELEGNGAFAVSISANEGYALKLKVYSLTDEEKYSANLTYSDGKYTTAEDVQLSNGFYRFVIVRTDTNAVVKGDSLRIVKDKKSTYSATFSFTTDGGVTIVNEMLDTPVIMITLSKENLTAEESLVAHADISGIENYEACWYVDGVAVGTYGEYSDLTYELTGKGSGTHEVSLCVRNSQVLWSEYKEFSIGNGAGRSLSLSNLAAGGSIELNGVDADTELELTGFSLEDGVYIEVVDDGRGVSRGLIGDLANLFRRQDGTYIPLPDEDGCAEFVAAAIGVVEDAKVIIHKLDKLDLDYEIDPKEDKYEGYDRKLAEEYYYINFLLPEFWHLDPEEIVIVTSGQLGAQGISLLQNGYLNRNINGVYDFSNKAITGFAVNMHRVLDEFGYNDVTRLHVLNPIHASVNQTVIDNDINVIRVDSQDAQQYKIVISFSGNDAEEVMHRIANEYQCLGMLPRYTDGSNRSMIYPEYDLEEKTITYHLGVVDRDFIFTLDFDSASTGFTPGNASMTLQVDSDGIVVHDMDELYEIEFVAETPGIMTWAFTVEDEVVFDVDVKNWCFDLRCHNISRTGSGTGGGLDPETMRYGTNNPDDVTTGFFLITYDGSEDDLPMSLFSFTRSGNKQLDCLDVAWDPETEDYVCINDNCEACAATGEKRHYNGTYIFGNKDVILDKLYWTADEYGEYGRIGYYKGTVRLKSSLQMDTGTLGNARKQYGVSSLQWNSQDTSKQIEICLTKILLSQNKIVCAIAFGGTTDFITDVEMFVETDWEYNNGYASRLVRGQLETRHALETTIGPGGPYRVVVTGSVIISVPSLHFEQTFTNGDFMTEALDGSAQVLFIAPDSDTEIEITDIDGYTYYIRSI